MGNYTIESTEIRNSYGFIQMKRLKQGTGGNLFN